MQLNFKKFCIAAAFGFTLFAIGFFAGARIGVQEFLYADAQYKASILAGNIKAIKAGKSDQLIAVMEIDLDNEIENHGKYMESNFTWLFPEWKSVDDRPIKHAVSYRLAYPFEGPDLSKPNSWNPGVRMDDPFVKDVVKGQTQGKLYKEKVLAAYGKKMDGIPLQETPHSGPVGPKR